MAHVGWAIEEHEEVLRLPKFLLHNVPTSERRKDQDRERAKRYRERKRDQLAGSNGKSTPKTSRDASRDFVTLQNRTNKQSSSLVNVGEVCLEETRRQAKSICRALYGDTAELMDSTRQTIWVFAWLAAAGILSEAEVADVIASACKPRVQNRAQYLRGCLDKKLTKRRSSWDDAFAAAPARPKPVPDEPK